MVQTRPDISAIISCFDSARFLPGCIEDLERQTWPTARKSSLSIAVPRRAKGYRSRLSRSTLRTFSICAPPSASRFTPRGTAAFVRRGDATSRAPTPTIATGQTLSNVWPTVWTSDRRSRSVYADVMKTATENETFANCTPTGRYRWYDWDRNLLLARGCFIGPAAHVAAERS